MISPRKRYSGLAKPNQASQTMKQWMRESFFLKFKQKKNRLEIVQTDPIQSQEIDSPQNHYKNKHKQTFSS